MLPSLDCDSFFTLNFLNFSPVKKYIKFNRILLAVLMIISGLSCKKKDEVNPNANVRGNYFSIRQFALYEWNTFAGEPILIIKSKREGKGKPDSSYTNSDTLNWAPIFETFFATDISDRKFLGQYTFTQFDDNVDFTHNFYYQANDKDLYTQKLLITIDAQSAKITGIYIETLKHSFLEDCTQKLYYNPLKTIQIQSDCKPRFGSKKFTMVQYDFMR